MECTIRNMKEEEYTLLNEFLYEAIYIPEGEEAPPKTITKSPQLLIYIEQFGKMKDDYSLVAEVEGKVVGAVWTRIMNDYGHIDDETPSFAISLFKDYRGLGIGTAMMKAMLLFLQDKGYKRTSLAVQKENYAVKMYRDVGFQIVDENEEEYIMLCNLPQS